MTFGRGTDWSPDGRFVLSAVQNPTTRRDLWALPLDGDRQPVAIAQPAFEERRPVFARWPMGRVPVERHWPDEIYVHLFPPSSPCRKHPNRCRWEGINF
jgi:hypothetical protein